ncbi:MAG: protoporphyrinogen oxidase [Actinomycetota bacterium]
MTGSGPADLAARAAERHVVVVGGGISGLVAAWECAKVGMRVTLLEESDVLGGAIRGAVIDGIAVDAGAESYATRGGHVRALVEELGLADRIVAPSGGGAWLAGIPGAPAAPLPAGGVLGIPSNPFRDDVRRIIGWSGAWRAYLDRIRPPLTIGHERSLGTLVRSRMGARVRDRLVAPVTTGVYSALPEDVDTDAAAPGLNAALTRVGSLSGAVEALRGAAAASRGTTPGAAVEGIAGGMTVLVEALRADLEKLGAVVRTSAPVHALEHRAPEGDAEAADAGATWLVHTLLDDAPDVLSADAVIVATAESTARELLDVHVEEWGEPREAPEIEVITLVLAAPDLDGAPRGTGVLTVPGSHTAKALTHATAKWAWLRAAAGDRHVVRVSFGSQGEQAATASLDEDAAAALALTEAEALLGVTLTPDMLRGAHRARYTQSQPASLIGAAESRAAARAALHEVDGLAVVGAWLAGTGLAQVVPDAVAEADRLRRSLIWE